MDGSYYSWGKSEPTGSPPLSQSVWDELEKALGLDREEADIQQVLTSQFEASNPTQEVAVLPPETVTHIPSQDVELTQLLLAVFKAPSRLYVDKLISLLEKKALISGRMSWTHLQQPQTTEEQIAVDFIHAWQNNGTFTLPKTCCLTKVNNDTHWLYITEKNISRPHEQTSMVSFTSPLYSFFMQYLWQGDKDLFSKCFELFRGAGRSIDEKFNVRIFSPFLYDVNIKESLAHWLIACGRFDMLADSHILISTKDLVHMIANGHLSKCIEWIDTHSTQAGAREIPFQNLKKAIYKLKQQGIITPDQATSFNRTIDEQMPSLSQAAPNLETPELTDILHFYDEIDACRTLSVKKPSADIGKPLADVKAFYDALHQALFYRASNYKDTLNATCTRMLSNLQPVLQNAWKPITNRMCEEQRWHLQKPNWGQVNVQSNLFFLPQSVMKSVDPQFYCTSEKDPNKKIQINLRQLLFNELSYADKNLLFRFLIYVQRNIVCFDRIVLYLDANRQFGYSYTLPGVSKIANFFSQ